MVTKEVFMKYEEARQGGNFNMVMDGPTVMLIYGIDKDDYIDILRNYNMYHKKFIG